MTALSATIDGNEAAARVAHKTAEVVAIYPITPSSTMAELADEWSAEGKTNIWGSVPQVVQMQSEGGAAGAIHGALQAGSVATTFTASQGLLLMLPNMFKIAGELTPTVFHVAARTVATHALSIFGDHSDVMACRSAGWGMLCASSVQEAHDFALMAFNATFAGRVPILHFFDGFRTSHELNRVDLLSDAQVGAMLDDARIREHRARALNPDRPVLRGSAQNPDVFFQAREASSPYYAALPGLVQAAMDRFADVAGRRYRLFDYYGASDADRVIVLMGSAAGAAMEAVDWLRGRGEKVGVLVVRLFRPFSAGDFIAALPPSVRSVAVLDRTKEPGAMGEPLYEDVVAALFREAQAGKVPSLPRVVGGRYGLASKEFTPAMAVAVFEEIHRPAPKDGFTIGIHDDVSHSSIAWDQELSLEAPDVVRALFYALGSDGTVGANKNTVKIVGEHTDLYAQGYFVYDSKKSGTVTVSHLRFSPRPIRSTYLIDRATFVGCHQFHLLERMDVLANADEGATLLLNSPFDAAEVWDHLPRETQEAIVRKRARLWVVDANRIAREAGLGGHVNTVLQPCFFALSGVLPREQAIGAIKEAIRKSYGRRGEVVVERNWRAVDLALAGLQEVAVPPAACGALRQLPPVPAEAPDFVQRVTARIIAGQGDLLPVSAFPADGTFPTGTARWEKRAVAHEIPIWDPDVCIECAKCAIVCPHAAIRMKVYEPDALKGAPAGFIHRNWLGKDFPGAAMTIQVAPDDCTGCGVCVDVCPAFRKDAVKHRAINMESRAPHAQRERENFAFFLTLPEADRTRVHVDSIKGSQMLEPLFEFSGACAGCGETPYLKLATQLFGDRMIVANATGCSSIYGGNLPTTPWAADANGRGPAWSNSLFEDNAEFGLGMRLALDDQLARARHLLQLLQPRLGEDFVHDLLHADQATEAGIAEQRARVARLVTALTTMADHDANARDLLDVASVLVRRSLWIVGGDGWAYDIGFGGLDHVLASGRDVNVLVLDTQVYSNTGGQASKATPRAAVAKFASSGKSLAKKDLGLLASAYGNVYVAQIALGADNAQTVKALAEADAHRGPSLVIAYSHCIAHGIDMRTGMSRQREAVEAGYWPLYRFRPEGTAGDGEHPLHLDSRKPKISFRDFALKEARFAMLALSNPAAADRLFDLAQDDIDERWRFYEQFARVERTAPGELEAANDPAADGAAPRG